jgi:hypothetical protein
LRRRIAGVPQVKEVALTDKDGHAGGAGQGVRAVFHD